MNMTHIAIYTLVGVVALLTILCCCMGYAIGSKDDRLNRLTDENRDLKDVIQDMESDMKGLPPPPLRKERGVNRNEQGSRG